MPELLPVSHIICAAIPPHFAEKINPEHVRPNWLKPRFNPGRANRPAPVPTIQFIRATLAYPMWDQRLCEGARLLLLYIRTSAGRRGRWLTLTSSLATSFGVSGQTIRNWCRQCAAGGYLAHTYLPKTRQVRLDLLKDLDPKPVDKSWDNPVNDPVDNQPWPRLPTPGAVAASPSAQKSFEPFTSQEKKVRREEALKRG